MKTENAIIAAYNAQPPYLETTIGEWRYKIGLDGQTRLILPGGYIMPVPGCPISPERLLAYQMSFWMVKNRRWWPALFLSAIALLLLNIGLLSTDESGEFRYTFINTFSFAMNAVLVVLLALCLIGAGLYNFGKGLKIKYDFSGEETKMLEAGKTIDVKPDVLVYSESEAETPGQYADRLHAAIMAIKPGQWVVSIPFRFPDIVIVRPKSDDDEDNPQIVCSRMTPPYESESWPDNMKTAQGATRFNTETYGQYLAYIRRFTEHFPEWSKSAKLQKGSPVDSLIDTMRRTASATVLCLLSVFAVAQKSAQVQEYLGEYRYNNDRPKGPVKFVFQKAILKRDGNGQTYRDILKDSPYYSDADNAGRLIGILVAGETIKPESPDQPKPTQAAASGSLQPISEDVPESGRKTFWESLPDSNRLEQMKAEFIRSKVGFGRELAPRQGFLVWVYWQFIAPLLFLLGLAAWYVAKSAYSDSEHSADGFAVFGHPIAYWGHAARYVVFGVVVVNTLVFIVDMAIQDYFNATNMWWWLLKSFIVSVIAWRFTQWIVPNPRVTSGRMMQGNNYPRLNG